MVITLKIKGVNIFNYYILITKFYIFQQKTGSKHPIFSGSLELLKV